MAYPKHIWEQLKNLSADDLIRALEQDGWEADACNGAHIPYLHPITRQRITIHYHPQKTYGPKLLQGLLSDIGWTEEDMQRLGMISGLPAASASETIVLIEQRSVLAWGLRCKGCGDLYVIMPVEPGQPNFPMPDLVHTCHKTNGDHRYLAEEFETVWVP